MCTLSAFQTTNTLTFLVLCCCSLFSALLSLVFVLLLLSWQRDQHNRLLILRVLFCYLFVSLFTQHGAHSYCLCVFVSLLLAAGFRYKFFSLGSEYNKTLTSEAKVTQANCVLLAAISIPQIRSVRFGSRLVLGVGHEVVCKALQHQNFFPKSKD